MRRRERASRLGASARGAWVSAPRSKILPRRIRPVQIESVVEAGYDLRGVMYWTLVDNFEWAEGYYMKASGGRK